MRDGAPGAAGTMGIAADWPKRPRSHGKPAHNFWAVSQAVRARRSARHQRFPRSTMSTANSTCEKPLRSPEPMAKSGPIFYKTAQKSHGKGTSIGLEAQAPTPPPISRGTLRCLGPNVHQRRKFLPLPPLLLALPTLIPGPDILLHPFGKMEGRGQVNPHVALV